MSVRAGIDESAAAAANDFLKIPLALKKVGHVLRHPLSVTSSSSYFTFLSSHKSAFGIVRRATHAGNRDL